MTQPPVENILSRLEKVKKRQPGQWSARCPAHHDHGPSLSVRETVDGGVLLHCFAGCGASDILASVGMTFRDLFPPRDRTGHEPQRTPRLLTAQQALELLRAETMLTAVAAANVAHGVVLSNDDKKRLLQASGRCNWIHDEFMGGNHV